MLKRKNREERAERRYFPVTFVISRFFLRAGREGGGEIRRETERASAANVVTKGQGNNFDSLTNSFVILSLPRAIERTDCTRDRLSTLHDGRFPNNPQNYPTIRVIALLHQLSADAARN